MTVSTFNEHNHAYDASITRAPPPVRGIIINAAVAGPSQIQTRRAVQLQYQDIVSSPQVTSLLNYYRSLAVPEVYSVDDIRPWCHEHSALLCGSTLIYEPYVPKFYINSCDNIFIFLTTRKLISTAPLSAMLLVDATFKLN